LRHVLGLTKRKAELCLLLRQLGFLVEDPLLSVFLLTEGSALSRESSFLKCSSVFAVLSIAFLAQNVTIIAISMILLKNRAS
jgi:hypothetical protein